MSNKTDKIKDIRAFTKAYLKSEAGRNALNRKPYTVRKDKSTTHVWQSPAMAVAFQQAVA